MKQFENKCFMYDDINDCAIEVEKKLKIEHVDVFNCIKSSMIR